MEPDLACCRGDAAGTVICTIGHRRGSARLPAGRVEPVRTASNMHGMLDDVDRSVAAWVAFVVGERATITFDPPTAEPRGSGSASGKKSDVVVHLVLVDVRRDMDGRASDSADVRDADGRVIARQGAAVPLRCSYLVTIAAADRAVEHRAMGALLRSSLDHAALPDEHRRGLLVDVPEHLALELAVAGASTPAARASTLGVPGCFALELAITVPILPTPDTEIAPPAEAVDLSVERDVPPVPPLPGVGPSDRNWRTYRVREPTN